MSSDCILPVHLDHTNHSNKLRRAVFHEMMEDLGNVAAVHHVCNSRKGICENGGLQLWKHLHRPDRRIDLPHDPVRPPPDFGYSWPHFGMARYGRLTGAEWSACLEWLSRLALRISKPCRHWRSRTFYATWHDEARLLRFTCDLCPPPGGVFLFAVTVPAATSYSLVWRARQRAWRTGSPGGEN